MKLHHLACVLCLAVVIGGCTSSFTGSGSSKSNVSIVDESERMHVDARLNDTDFVQFAETVTNKMLSSSLVAGWGEKKPKVVVGILRNNTDDENIRIADVHDRIQEMLMASGAIRVMDSSATDFDYILRNNLTSTPQRDTDSGEKLVEYVLMMKLYKVDGELVGQWSDKLKLRKG